MEDIEKSIQRISSIFPSFLLISNHLNLGQN
jgi:hypothetical protein